MDRHDQVTLWHTGGVTRMCECGGPQIKVYTDGKRQYAHCDKCKKTWDMDTLEEIKNESV